MNFQGHIKKTICFDFDGVIASYDKWRGFDVLGSPNIEVIKTINNLYDTGAYITIWTTRPDTPVLRKWLKENGVKFHSVNSTSHNPPTTSCKPIYHVYIDDRAINYHGQSSENLTDEILKQLTKNFNQDVEETCQK